MSNFQALALILITMGVGVYVIVDLQKYAQAMLLVLATGVDKVVPISIEHRWMVLWSFYVPNAAFGVALTAAGAFGLAQVGINVTDPAVRAFAYLCAGGSGLSSLMWILGTASGVHYAASILRERKRS